MENSWVNLQPNGEMTFSLGTTGGFTVVGGPYKAIPEGYLGVKMAREIGKVCHIDVPTEDFQVPLMEDFQNGVMEAGIMLLRGQCIYVGCMGGIGRTGLFLAGLAMVDEELKASSTKRMIKRLLGYRPDPKDQVTRAIRRVRSEYMASAVETDAQEAFLLGCDPAPVADIIEKSREIPLSV